MLDAVCDRYNLRLSSVETGGRVKRSANNGNNRNGNVVLEILPAPANIPLKVNSGNSVASSNLNAGRNQPQPRRRIPVNIRPGLLFRGTECGPYGCPECRMHFGSLEHLELHTREHERHAVRNGIQVVFQRSACGGFLCSKCGAHFRHFEQLKLHIRISHSGG